MSGLYLGWAGTQAGLVGDSWMRAFKYQVHVVVVTAVTALGLKGFRQHTVGCWGMHTKVFLFI